MEKPNLHLKVKLAVIFALFSASIFSQTIAPFSSLPVASSCDTLRDRIVYLSWNGSGFVNRIISPGVILRKASGLSGLTTGYIPVATSSTTLGNGIFFQKGRNVTLPASKYLTGADTSASTLDMQYGGVAGNAILSASKSTFSEGFAGVSPTGAVLGYKNSGNFGEYTLAPGIARTRADSLIFIARDNYFQIDIASKGNGKVLTSDANGVATWSSGFVTGTGTANYLPMWSSSSGLTNSYLSQSGRNIILPASRFITSYDTLGCQIDLSYSGQRKSFNISTDGGADNEAWVYGDSSYVSVGFGAGGGTFTGNATSVSIGNSVGAHSVVADSSINNHTSIVSLKAPLVRVTGTFAVKDGSQAVGKVFTCTNATTGAGTWQTATSGTVTGSGTTNAITKWTSSSAVGASSVVSDDGTNLKLANNKSFTSADGTTGTINFGANEAVYFEYNDGVNNSYQQFDTAGLYLQAAKSANSSYIHLRPSVGAINVASHYINLTADSTITLNGRLAGTSIDTDGTFAANSDSVVPSQKAVKTYVTSATSGFGTGSVTSIATGNGITGGTITTTGTLGLSGATGDIGSFSGTNTYSAISAVASGSYLRSAGTSTKPVWSTTTLPNSATTGDLMYASASNTYSNLAAVASGSYLRSGGTSTAPLWSTLKLPNSATANYIPYATSSNTWGESSGLQYDGTTFTALTNTKINSSGVGINTTPSSAIPFSATGTITDTYRSVLTNNSTANGAYCQYAVANSSTSLNIGIVGTGTTTSGEYVQGQAYNMTNSAGWSFGTNNASGVIRFYSGSGSQNMTLIANGNLGIGSATPSVKLDVNGSVNCTGGTCSSDVRWKKNIKPIDNSLTKVMQLQGVYYDWRKDEFPNKDFDDKKQIGFIAQDVEKIFPELVRTDNEGYKSMDYQKMVAILVEAIKEQQKEIELLKQK